MTLKRYVYEERVVAVTMIECPLCEYEFAPDERRWKHFVEDHDPDDLG